MRRELIPVFCIVLFTTTAVFAQDEPAVAHLLRWFPCGETGNIIHVDEERFISTFPDDKDFTPKDIPETYIVTKIVHLDVEKFVETCPQEISDLFVAPGRKLLTTENHQIGWRVARLLPPSFDGQYESMTKASIGTLGVKLNEAIAVDGTRRPLNRKCAYGYVANGYRYCAWLPTRSLYVYRFADLDALVRRALREGELEPLVEDPVFERPILGYRPSKEGKHIFCYATASQELLVAEDLNDLKNMIQAGMYGNAQDSEVINTPSLRSVSSDSYLWTFQSEVAMYDLLLDYLQEKDPDSPSIESVKERLETGKQNIVNEYSWDGGAQSHCITIFYGDEEGAENDYRKLSRSEDKDEFLVLNTLYFLGHAISFKNSVRQINDVRNEMTLELDGNRLIITRIDDKEVLLRVLDVLRMRKELAEEK